MTQPTPALRLITEEDRSEVERMAIAFFEASEYRHMGIEKSEVNQLIDSFLVDRNDKTCFLLVIDDKVVGMLAAMSAKNLFNKRNSCLEVIWWIDQDYRGFKQAKLMMDAYQYWASEIKKAQVIQMTCLDTFVAKLYRRRGFRLAEYTYIKEL